MQTSVGGTVHREDGMMKRIGRMTGADTEHGHTKLENKQRDK